MSDKVSRRDFLKLAGLSAAASAVLTGCGPASRYVVREPYTAMPEYSYNGASTYYATTCRECPAGCGLIVRTMQGRAIKVEGNKRHPANLGKTCSRGQASVQGLYDPDRVQNPGKHTRGNPEFQAMNWEQAIQVVQEALQNHKPEEIAFLTGLAPDHLFDLLSRLASAMGAPKPLRVGAYGMFEARSTLSKAAENMFGQPNLMFFDIGGAEVTFSFGANFLETWISPLAYTRGYAAMRQGTPNRRGYLVQFEPRMSQTATNADEWIPVVPGTEGLVALAIGRLAAEDRGGALPAAFAGVNVAEIAERSGVAEEELHRLARIFARADRPLAIPGGVALGQTNGLATAEAVLAMNAIVGNLGQPGGVSFAPAVNVYADRDHRPASMQAVSDFVAKMRSGAVKVLFVHGVNPAFELPGALGFADALANVPLVISFSSFLDETTLLADYVFPDHTSLEAWGYQRIPTGGDRAAISGAQPVVVPFQNTRATADVFLAAVQAIGGSLAAAVPFADEVAFLQDAVLSLIREEGFYSAPEIKTFFASFQQFGGWWAAQPGLEVPAGGSALSRAVQVAEPEFEGDGEFHLVPFLSPILGDGSGANRPWLQETPDPTTTVMWNSWVEIHPKTAEELGLHDDDVVLVVSPAGAVEATVYRYPAIRPDTVAMPFGQGHTSMGRYAAGRGANPAHLLGLKFNAAGDLAFGAMKVHIRKTGRQRPIARMESRLGVYGDGLHE